MFELADAILRKYYNAHFICENILTVFSIAGKAKVDGCHV